MPVHIVDFNEYHFLWNFSKVFLYTLFYTQRAAFVLKISIGWKGNIKTKAVYCKYSNSINTD